MTTQDIDAIVTDIAAHLPGWDVVHPDGGGYARLKNGDAALTFMEDQKALVVAPIPLFNLRTGERFPRQDMAKPIRVNPGRGGEKLAREIERRLMPRYLDALDRGRKELCDVLKHIAGRDQLTDDLRRIAMDERAVDPQNSGRVYLHPPGGKEWYGTVEVQGDNSVRIDIGCVPGDLAAQILQLLMTYERNRLAR